MTPRTASTTPATGETLVQGKSGLPVFVGVMAFAVKAVIDKAAARGTASHEGDVWIFNDPYDGGTHLSDFRLVKPDLPRRRAVLLPRLGRPLARRRRQRAGQLQPGRHRVLPGRHADPAGEALRPGRVPPGHRRHPVGQLPPAGLPLWRPQRPDQRPGPRRQKRMAASCWTNMATPPSPRPWWS